ncbi:hypothetical protein V8C86DRAFT_2597428 [Haematococcus lacustris]
MRMAACAAGTAPAAPACARTERRHMRSAHWRCCTGCQARWLWATSRAACSCGTSQTAASQQPWTCACPARSCASWPGPAQPDPRAPTHSLALTPAAAEPCRPCSPAQIAAGGHLHPTQVRLPPCPPASQLLHLTRAAARGSLRRNKPQRPCPLTAQEGTAPGSCKKLGPNRPPCPSPLPPIPPPPSISPAHVASSLLRPGPVRLGLRP